MAASIASLTAKAQAIGRFPTNPPIHNAIAFMDDKSDLLEFIREFHSLDPSCVSKKDDNGITPIYLAASSSQLDVTRLLLEKGANVADLRTRETADRITPLMAIQDNLRKSRNFLSGRVTYIGRNPCKAPLADEVEIERLLKEAIGDYGLSTTCSCRLCDQGWMSERMRALLYSTSQRIIEGMSQRIRRRAFSDPQDPYLPFLPLPLRQKISPRLYLGYKSVMVLISNVLANTSGKIPDWPTIGELFPPRDFIDEMYGRPTKSPEWFYRESDGHIDNVLECLIETAARAYDDQADPKWIKKSEQMRSCNNDYNFDLVRRKLGMWGDMS